MTTAAEGLNALIATFLVHDTLCGIDTSAVQEVIRLEDVTEVPHAPETIVGIINLRGRIVTVLDLGLKLELGRLDIGTDSRVFVIQHHGESVGLLVDKVAQVVEVDQSDLVPPPSSIGAAQGRCFKGIHQEDTRLIAVLDLEGVLGGDGQ